jgi:hypothetical protein
VSVINPKNVSPLLQSIRLVKAGETLRACGSLSPDFLTPGFTFAYCLALNEQSCGRVQQTGPSFVCRHSRDGTCGGCRMKETFQSSLPSAKAGRAISQSIVAVAMT